MLYSVNMVIDGSVYSLELLWFFLSYTQFFEKELMGFSGIKVKGLHAIRFGNALRDHGWPFRPLKEREVMELAEIKIHTDGGPWAFHNMPCAVCRKEHAILQLWDGTFQPCWACQKEGYEVIRVNKKSFIYRVFGLIWKWK